MRIVLQALRKHRLYAKFSKCEFYLTEVRFLGHVISTLGLSLDIEKVEAVMSWERLNQSSRYVVSWDCQGTTGDLFRTSLD